MNEIDLIINAATLLSKDLLVDNQNSQKFFGKIFTEPQLPSTLSTLNNETTEESDLDLIFFSNLLRKKQKKSRKRKSENQSSEINPMDLLEEVRLSTSANKRPKTDEQHNNGQSPVSLSGSIKYPFFQFLRDCDDLTFENHFKLTKRTFVILQAALEPLLEPLLKRSALPLTKSQIILSTLWLLTTEETISSVGDRFNIPKEICQKSFKLMCEAVSRNKQIFIKWPAQRNIAQVMQQFNEIDEENLFPNVCGIIGCLDIRVAPNKNSSNPSPNSNDKRSIVKLQVVCGPNGMFMNSFVELTEIGSNVLVFNRSPLKRMLDNNPYALPPDGHFLGDQSYPLRTFLMVPFKEPRRSPEMQLFNMHLELKRKIVDREFCKLLERFSRLKFINMQVSTELIQCIELACAFHNFCIQQNDSYYLQIEEESANSDKAICRDFTTDHRAFEKRNKIVDKITRT